MDERKIINALSGVLVAPGRPPALAGLSRPKYPMREFNPTQNADGTLSVKLTKWGYEYKHRGPRPKKPSPVNPAAVRVALNAILPDGVTVTAVEDHGTHIILTLEETNLWMQF